jgi:DNA-binding MarR family transcriptional regulator
MMEDNKQLSRLLTALVGLVRKGPNLTARQLVTLLQCYTDKPQTVRGLAEYLNVDRPIITLIFDRLSEQSLLRRRVDHKDLRSVLSERTPQGEAYIRNLCEGIMGVPVDSPQLLILRDTIAAHVQREGVDDDEADLRIRSFAVLLICHLRPSAQTIRGLAAELEISKSAIVRAVDVLEARELVCRKPDRRDRRSVLVGRTLKGVGFIRHLRGTMAAARDRHNPQPHRTPIDKRLAGTAAYR